MENQVYITQAQLEQESQQEEVNQAKRKKWIPIIVAAVILLFLLSGLVLAVIMVGDRTNLGSKAYTTTSTENPETLPSKDVLIENSYAFASPLYAKSGGEKIRITVIVLDGRGFGVPGKEVSIGIHEAINIKAIQSESDEFGKAIFDITADKVGTYVIEPSVDGSSLNQTLNIVFN